jgi:DNA repair protein RecO (recombination protein O)
MLINSTGIILRSVKYSETSLILDIYTRAFGLKTYIVNGARKKNSALGAALLQVSNIVEIVAYNKENTKINRIKEVRISKVFSKLSFDIQRFSVALLILEILNKSVKDIVANEKLFDFVENILLFIDQNDVPPKNLHISALCEISKFLGFAPENNYAEKTCFFDLREGKFTEYKPLHNDFIEEPVSKYLHTILTNDFLQVEQMYFPRNFKHQLLEKLILYYKIHLTNFGMIKTYEVFKNIFSSN